MVVVVVDRPSPLFQNRSSAGWSICSTHSESPSRRCPRVPPFTTPPRRRAPRRPPPPGPDPRAGGGGASRSTAAPVDASVGRGGR
eukprot:21841-Pelagococcus_subviridis.AAC.1